MRFSDRINTFLFAVMLIPTTNLTDWKVEQFSGVPKNEVTASEKGIRVHVDKSAGPLIHPLKAITKITGFKISGHFLGLPQFAKASSQGEKGFDDYSLRVGFVLSGEKTLTGLKKAFAANWVKRLYEQAPEGTGIDSVRFFNVTQNPQQIGRKRLHPATDLFQEEFFAEVKSSGPYLYDIQFEKPIEIVAIWISIDGDDTNSTYDVLISNLELHVLLK
ncbi:MAG: hypothetical protein A2622_09510 [Bdellovibrionales bacterium RIFCSPHIGHO2_01_FULL_40_29]|nr:MAG: hypothetical protein A2622_09510 [Bdellovibrionales bacterium RIFCSPHIGHO2_01_FULL_40_29]OFZ33540.1 MAG: hypothetical protein A3D17_00110 [Bdellovibrionales bacterium RIFCSPHIGHO2_02_FULL_40_15]